MNKEELPYDIKTSTIFGTAANGKDSKRYILKGQKRLKSKNIPKKNHVF